MIRTGESVMSSRAPEKKKDLVGTIAGVVMAMGAVFAVLSLNWRFSQGKSLVFADSRSYLGRDEYHSRACTSCYFATCYGGRLCD
jgi:hypothetical protein